ncbi:hypothetical protein Cgig2_028657 [Carnegiea gigantea]|uniref:Uncharacterized protein n=1 Tax=Carnegiea gigantea TaxID=171969 RepID=A0A9Q1GNL4_9CARY|nr:hypothetical protein Cgig2_028657 [Carnegiea gigantea]
MILEIMNTSMTNLMDCNFTIVKMRCKEEQWVTVTRFINGLSDDLKGEVSLHHLDTNSLPILTGWFPKLGSLSPLNLSPFRKPLILKGNHRIGQFGKSSSLTSPPLIPSPSLFSMVCNNCHERGHPTSRYANRALIVGLDTLEDDDQIDETVYFVVGDTATESEHEDIPLGPPSAVNDVEAILEDEIVSTSTRVKDAFEPNRARVQTSYGLGSAQDAFHGLELVKPRGLSSVKSMGVVNRDMGSNPAHIGLCTSLYTKK